VRGKTYDSEHDEGRELFQQVHARLAATQSQGEQDVVRELDAPPAYGAEYLARARLGQGAFRVLVTDAYQRRCAITGEKTLPALDAAHIKPYSENGPHSVSNGLLLRSDWHRLYDGGYVTVTPEFRIEVSSRIREEFSNGRDYYAHHGSQLVVVPSDSWAMPSRQYLDWHNQNIYKT
jgi:putative restriction endonuclease